MKVIDLLNKIANGEEPPEKIKFNDYEYSYHDKKHGYCRHNYDCTYICFDSEYNLFDILNDEIDIIQDNKIEKISLEIDKFEDSYYDTALIKLAGKIDEIIDKLNEVLNEKDR